jgi:hypothetical protein
MDLFIEGSVEESYQMCTHTSIGRNMLHSRSAAASATASTARHPICRRNRPPFALPARIRVGLAGPEHACRAGLPSSRVLLAAGPNPGNSRVSGGDQDGMLLQSSAYQ